ncbi:MAG: fumarylacetoacetate hydrolase family protein [Gammaproteobacteria bacterium]|nr:MAG: fumarylacetoacetate hydrolase family protein [Gammaproteobacteria bacterium]
MRLITYTAAGDSPRLGAWIDADTRVVDLQRAAIERGEPGQLLSSMLALIRSGAPALDLARACATDPPAASVRPTRDCRLMAPLPEPTQIRDFLCFEDHLKNVLGAAIEMRARGAPDPEATRAALRDSPAFQVPPVWYQRPLYYNCSRLCVAGTDAEIQWPAYSRLRDYELEFAAVIGSAGRDIGRDTALRHIFGYTIFNDLSARDEQFVVMDGKLGPGKGKDFDGSNVFGPCIVTADEVPDPYALTMVARVNGVEWSRGTSASMHYRFEDLIAYLSQAETLHPGEILGSGTVGSGSGFETLRFLEPGDTVELEVERIGVLRTRIATR